eukprot:7291292-Prymnesium_polylepis.1
MVRRVDPIQRVTPIPLARPVEKAAGDERHVSAGLVAWERQIRRHSSRAGECVEGRLFLRP